MGENVVNSEFKKVNLDMGEPEADCREMSQEWLLHKLFESKTKDNLARKVNVNTKGSKLDIRNRIRSVLIEINGRVNKIFIKRFGCLGGWSSSWCHIRCSILSKGREST